MGKARIAWRSAAGPLEAGGGEEARPDIADDYSSDGLTSVPGSSSDKYRHPLGHSGRSRSP